MMTDLVEPDVALALTSEEQRHLTMLWQEPMTHALFETCFNQILAAATDALVLERDMEKVVVLQSEIAGITKLWHTLSVASGVEKPEPRGPSALEAI